VRAFIVRAIGVLLLLSAIALALSHAPDRPVETLVARWAPPPSDFIEVKGQVVHLRDEGPRDDALPVVLLHGTSSSLHTWEGWVGGMIRLLHPCHRKELEHRFRFTIVRHTTSLVREGLLPRGNSYTLPHGGPTIEVRL